MILQWTNYILVSKNDTKQQQINYIFCLKKGRFGFSLFLLAETSLLALQYNLSDGTEVPGMHKYFIPN